MALDGRWHGHKLHFHGHSAIHRAPRAPEGAGAARLHDHWSWRPHARGYAAFALYLLALVVVIVISRVPLTCLLEAGQVVELLFVFASSCRLSCGPADRGPGVWSASTGLEAASRSLVKGTLGVLASLTLAATTEPQDLLAGLERSASPVQLVAQIMAFMVRYPRCRPAGYPDEDRLRGALA